MEIDPRLVGEDEAMKDVLWIADKRNDDGGDEGSGIYAGDSGDEGSDVSEADSDYLELQADIARLDASRNAFLSEHLGADYDPMDDAGMRKGGSRAAGGASGSAAAASVAAAAARRRRGPRKAAEPTGEVKYQLQQAHQLFMDLRYEDALAALHEIIRVNAETHAAWSLMASINEDLGRREEAMMAKLFAAHLEPKNVAGWLNAADYALEIAAEAEALAAADGDHGEDDDDAARQARRLQNLQVAQLCYSGAIRADKDNIPARLGKANVCLEFGQATNAATEYVRVLKRRPLALQVIRNLAEASYDSVRGPETIQAAISAYRKATAYLRSRSSEASSSYFAPYLVLDEGEEFTWMDITIYVELFASLQKYSEAIALLKTLARWMLGRGGPDEAYWATMPKSGATGENAEYEHGDDDDREWDRYDEPRRRLVPGFQPGRYPASAYGEGLPVDLRTKLAIYRLKLGHEDEAIEHLSWIDPQDAGTTESMRMYPHLLKDVGAELFESRRFELALQYLELYRDLSRSLAAELNGYDLGGAAGDSSSGGGAASAEIPDDDADALVLQGKCNLELHDHAAAEESFLAAIEADDENIDARFELAKMYEKAQAKEQAYILVNEALSLEAAQQKRQQAERQEREDRDGAGRVGGQGHGNGGGDGDGDGEDGEGGARGPSRRRGPMASLETGSYRVFFNEEGKVVRRRRKFRKGPDGQEVLISAEQNRLNRAARQGYGDDDGMSDAYGVPIRPKPPGGAGAQPTTSAQKQLRQLQRQQRREQQAGNPRQPRRRPRLARRLFASPAEQAEFEASTSARLRARYQKCQEAKARGDAGDADAAAEWMEAAKELINDFRSFREFYTWDKYVQFLGVNNLIQDNSSAAVPAMEATPAPGGPYSSGLTALAERLQQNLAPADDTDANANRRRDYRGIPFDDWLALFLEYALGLAHAGRTAEAYAVCQSAHDSIVYRQEDSMFLIHLAWASCAVRAGDEETCVAVGRYFMRDRPYTTDCYRLFTVMCRLCRAPLSGSGPGSSLGPGAWFSSSPAQKYILRQIRQKDDIIRQDAANSDSREGGPYAGLDACLLVVYGHILFASTSYHFALNYYQRALAVDPGNPVINMCIGLSYVHWALKRQAENRQYLVTQGLNFLYQYAEGRMGGRGQAGRERSAGRDPYARREAFYNLGRTYHLLGLHALAAEFYGKVLREDDTADSVDAGDGSVADAVTKRPVVHTDLRIEAAYNLRTYYILAGNNEAAMQITRAYLVM